MNIYDDGANNTIQVEANNTNAHDNKNINTSYTHSKKKGKKKT